MNSNLERRKHSSGHHGGVLCCRIRPQPRERPACCNYADATVHGRCLQGERGEPIFSHHEQGHRQQHESWTAPRAPLPPVPGVLLFSIEVPGCLFPSVISREIDQRREKAFGSSVTTQGSRYICRSQTEYVFA